MSSSSSGLPPPSGLEYGAHGKANVSAHQRRVSMVFGRAVSPTIAMVEAYKRTVNIQAHSFLRGPLEAMSAEIFAQLESVITSTEGGGR